VQCSWNRNLSISEEVAIYTVELLKEVAKAV
jgi:hypothetical protein